MLDILGGAYRLCDGVTRREFLRVGGLGLLGFTLGDLFALRRASAASPPKEISVIILWLSGGASHLDTFDPKPDAPGDVRGEFKPIETNVSGIRFAETLPLTAKHADKLAVLRSVCHTHNDHDASQWMLSGYFYTPIAQSIQYPSMGSVFLKLKGERGPMPPFVHLPTYHKFVVRAPEGFGAGYLGQRYDPILLSGDPNAKDYRVPDIAPNPRVGALRVERRRGLRRMVDEALARLEQRGEIEGLDASYERAFDVVTSPEAQRAFDLQREPDAVRDHYGRTTFGQCCLMARRLVEAGCRFVTINWPGSFAWDTHGSNFKALKETLCPTLDRPFAALLEDLHQRGLLDTTLVVCMGEFGRTPRINKDAGRDHWQSCFSLAVAGAGVRGGQVIGASDALGEYPAERPIAPEDLCATIYTLLGVDYTGELQTPLNRPVRILPGGGPIQELFA